MSNDDQEAGGEVGVPNSLLDSLSKSSELSSDDCRYAPSEVDPLGDATGARRRTLSIVLFRSSFCLDWSNTFISSCFRFRS